MQQKSSCWLDIDNNVHLPNNHQSLYVLIKHPWVSDHSTIVQEVMYFSLFSYFFLKFVHQNELNTQTYTRQGDCHT